MQSKNILIAYKSEIFGEEFRIHMERHFDSVQIANSILDTTNKAQMENFDTIIAEDKIAFNSDNDELGNNNLRPLLRKAGIKTPLIIIGDKTNANSHFEETENDKFIAKPFDLINLINIIKATISSHEDSENAEFSIGEYTLQQPLKRLLNSINGKTIDLTEKEIAILQYLYKVGEISVDKETLLHEVWGYHPDITTHTLETHIYRLRQKMGEHSHHIATEQDGYRLIR